MMNTKAGFAGVLKGTLLLIVAGAMGTGCFSVEIPYQILEPTKINFGDFSIGIGVEYEDEEPLCGAVPDNINIRELIAQQMGGLVAALLHIDGVWLSSIVLEASAGNFNNFKLVNIYYRSSDSSIEPFNFGDAHPQMEGLGTKIELEPDRSMNFLQVLAIDGGVTEEPCPALGLHIMANMPTPEENPTFTGTITLVVTGHIGLF